MTYRIRGLAPQDFAPLFVMADAELAERSARRVIASADRGFPCRVTLRDAPKGTELILLHHISHVVDTPYRSAYAIYVSQAEAAAEHIDSLPPVFEGRPLGMRGFDAQGNLSDARLAMPGKAEQAIADILSNPEVAYIDAHNAAHGCFSARIERHGDFA